MQAVIALPPLKPDLTEQQWRAALRRKISGVPLLERVMATAWKAGISEFVIISPERAPAEQVQAWLTTTRISHLPLRMVAVKGCFDAEDPARWEQLRPALHPRFLWLPSNFVTLKTTLSGLTETGDEQAAVLTPGDGARVEAGTAPAVVNTAELLGSARGLSHYLNSAAVCRAEASPPAGIVLDSSARVAAAEQLLVRGSGKASDGVYSRFNRWLSRLPVKWLLRTPVSANAITLSGIPTVLGAGYLYSLGTWGGYAAGGLLYFVSVLIDEMDGMVARTRFEESAFGCWLETAVDYLGYLVLWSGMAIGLSRQYGSFWLWLGGVTIVANLLTFRVLVSQRKRVTSADHPEAYQKRFYGRLEDDAASFVSVAIRKVVFLAKKGVMCHYILLFSVLGLLRLLFGLAAFGSILTFFIALYMNRLFQAPAQRSWEQVDSVGVRR